LLSVPSSATAFPTTATRSDTLSRAVVPLIALAGVLTALYAIPFSAIPWPLSDVYAVLEKAQLPWGQAVRDAFARDVEYRPLFILLVKALYGMAGLHLWFYKAIVLAQFAAILSVFIILTGPDQPPRVLAALLSLTVLLGLHTTRILFSFFPLNHHSLVILLVLIAAGIAIAPRWRHANWVLPLITLAGLMFIEFGLLIPVVLTALMFANAPNATRRSVSGAWIALVIYAVVRLTLTTQTEFPIAHAETGLGFQIVERDDLNRIFANAPWLFWAYNVMATFFTVLFSEPRGGIFYFVQTLLKGNTMNWLWLHVISSAATTILVIWALVKGDFQSPRDRQLVWLGGTLVVAGSLLGFLYARDRIGLPVGLGYALLLYVAASRLLEQPSMNIVSRSVVSAVLVALLAAWAERDVEAWFQIRDTAWERRVEWTERFVELTGSRRKPTPLLEEMRIDGVTREVIDPRLDPPWMYTWFERRVKPLHD
jgi:hypothetical protein